MDAARQEQLEEEVAAIIRRAAAIGYSFTDEGPINGSTPFIAARGAAHLIVHHVLKVLGEAK